MIKLMRRPLPVALAVCALAVVVAAGCGSSKKSSSSTTTSASGGGGGGGKIEACALLPDTKSSTRYTLFDAPYLKEAFANANVSAQVLNALGDSQKQKSQAQQCLAKGAKVILLDQINAASGNAITNLAVQQGAKVIDYDRLVPGSKAAYYVSFDNVGVGKLQGKGLVAALKANGTYTQKPVDRRAERRHHGQQRQAVQAGLRLGARPALRERHPQEGEGRRPVDRLGSDQGPPDLRPDAGPQQQQHQGRRSRPTTGSPAP